MPELRELLAGAGYGEPRTYVQSGNIVLDSDRPAAELEADCARLLAERFGFDVQVVSRTADELAAVIARNPLAGLATDPKRYQVSFLSGLPAPDAVARLASLAAGGEQLVADGRELYVWHPDGVARSKLASRLAAAAALGPDVHATARNWTTVTTLLEMTQTQATE